jgi:hypothetical protein
LDISLNCRTASATTRDPELRRDDEPSLSDRGLDSARGAAFLAVDFLTVDFLAVDFLAADFFAVDLFAVDFLVVDFAGDFFAGVLLSDDSSSAMVSFPLLSGQEALDEGVLGRRRLLRGQVSVAAGPRDVVEQRADPGGVVVLVLGLPEHDLGDRDRPSYGGERQPEQAGEQAHHAPPAKS